LIAEIGPGKPFIDDGNRLRTGPVAFFDVASGQDRDLDYPDFASPMRVNGDACHADSDFYVVMAYALLARPLRLAL
jgi:hypothetical protein